MSNPVELLRRALEIWEKSTSFVTDWAKLHKEIRAYLDTEPEAEPVELVEYDAGYLNDYGGGNVSWWQDYIRYELGEAHEHYAEQFEQYANQNPVEPKPESKSKPMKTEEIRELGESFRYSRNPEKFIDFARAIEKHHKIGDEE